MEDLISIIMPSYNTGEFIAESVQSVVKQTYENWELIIVDDCSTDNTDKVLQPYLADKRIRYLKNDKNFGAAISRNRAIKEAKGRYIAFLDSDDLWKPEKLERQLAFMKEHHYGFTYTDYRIQLNGVWQPYINTAPNMINKRKMYHYCYFSTITVMYDSSVVGLIQIADIKKNNDYAMWLQAVEKTDFYRLPQCLSYYIKHDHSISSGSKMKLIKHHYILFRKALHRDPVSSVFLTANNLFHGIIKKVKYRKYI